MTKNPEIILREHGCKVTTARISIIGLFSNYCHPMNAEEVYKRVKKTKIDLATVYRTLQTFEKKSIIKQVIVSSDATYYELDVDDHHHAICTKCKKVSDFTGGKHNELVKSAIKQVRGFKSISRHSFDLFGICNNCAKK